MNLVTDVQAEIDGIPVRNLAAYRAESPLFTYGPLPENNVLQLFKFAAPAGATSLSVADGFYLMLAPLHAGDHIIHFGGTFFGDHPISGPIDFTLDITYHLTVK